MYLERALSAIKLYAHILGRCIRLARLAEGRLALGTRGVVDVHVDGFLGVALAGTHLRLCHRALRCCFYLVDQAGRPLVAQTTHHVYLAVELL